MIQVILLEKIHKIGNIGDIAFINNGYALHHLLPKKKVLKVNDIIKKKFKEYKNTIKKIHERKKQLIISFLTQIRNIPIILNQEKNMVQYSGTNYKNICQIISNEFGIKIDYKNIFVINKKTYIKVYNIYIIIEIFTKK